MTKSFFDNYKVKLVVIMFAIFVWFYVITEDNYDNVLEIPVTLLNIPAGKTVLNDYPKTCKIKINGNGKGLIALHMAGGANLFLDLADAQKRKTFEIEAKDIILSRRADDLRIEEIIMPETITIELDDLQNKKVPITNRIKPSPAAGYTIVGNVRLAPDSIQITGPKSLVSEINEIKTEEKTVKDLRYDLKEKIAVIPPESGMITLSAQQTDVFINIQPLVEMTLSGIPVKVTNTPPDVVVYVVPSTLSLVLEGGGELIAGVGRNDINAYINYNLVKRAPGKEYVPAIEVPSGLSYKDQKPKTFKLVEDSSSP